MKNKIIIIGAGISGVYLAYLLEKKYDITILESRDRAGGRIFSVDSHDLGPSWIWSHQKNILELVNSLGLELFAQDTKGYALYEAQGKVEMFSPQPSAPSARMKGSLSQLINAIKDKLINTTIVFNTKVESIKEEKEVVVVSSKEIDYSCEYVISTLPPRLAQKLSFSPPLSSSLQSKMSSTQTWMGNSVKCVVEFKTKFWKTKSLSGFVFSHMGPLGEIHDASFEEKNALFGFVNSNADMRHFENALKEQLTRLFGIDESEILNIHLVDWREEKATSADEDSLPLREHPSYGIDASSYSDKILFSSTEFSFNEGGYLEGAIINAQNTANKLLAVES